MALSDIIAKITTDAEAEGARITAEAKAEAAEILKRAEAEASEIAALGVSDAERAASKARGRIVASATHESKFALQSFRVSLINRAFEQVEKALKDMPKDTYHTLVKNRAAALPEKSGAVTVSSERKAETLEALKQSGISTKDAAEAPLVGGFILETKTALYDHSLKTSIARSRDEYAHDVVQTLFGS